jgi:Dirigent-like protein
MTQDGASCAERHNHRSKGEDAVKRTMLFVAVGVFALWAQAGSAQAPGPTTLSLYEPANGGTFKILDNAPRSPAKNPASKKYRFSVGDQLIFSNPVLDHKGGTRVATLYVEATVVKGKTFASVVTSSRVVLVFTNGDQLAAQGVFSFSGADVRIAIVGGTGTYQGARGSVVSHNNADDSSQDTITLLP